MDEADGRDHGLKPPSTTIKIAGLQLARTTCPLRSSASMRSDPLFTKSSPSTGSTLSPRGSAMRASSLGAEQLPIVTERPMRLAASDRFSDVDDI